MSQAFVFHSIACCVALLYVLNFIGQIKLMNRFYAAALL